MPDYTYLAAAAVFFVAIISVIFIMRSGKNERENINTQVADKQLKNTEVPLLPDSSHDIASEPKQLEKIRDQNTYAARQTETSNLEIEAPSREDHLYKDAVVEKLAKTTSGFMKDTTLLINYSNDIRNYGYGKDTLSFKKPSGKLINPTGQKIYIRFNRADVRTFGYEFEKDTLELYGVDTAVGIQLAGLDKKTYLLMDGKAYMLKQSGIYHNFEPETSREILKRIGL